MKPILVIDNYDSFTYNLVHYLLDLGQEVAVYRNDKIALEQVQEYDRIVLSPGPGVPEDAGLLKDIIRENADSKHIFGVCLGMQAIGEVFGGKLKNLDQVYHGTATTMKVTAADPLFDNLPEQMHVGRYHSWVVDPDLPEDLLITSEDEKGQVMSLRHKTYSVCGVQFHPESVLTEHGKAILSNWLSSTSST